MSTIHYFQRYSQKENAVTNNTLLLFSRLYQHSPPRFQEFLQDALPGIKIEVGVSFIQQQATKKRTKKVSVPDGRLAQDSFKVVVETKLGDKFSRRQIKSHLDAFGNETTKVLLLLSPAQLTLGHRQEIQQVIDDFNREHQTDIQLVQTTFEGLIAGFDHVLQERDHDMRDLLMDYQAFCDEDGLLPGSEYTMRAVPCGKSIDENFQFRLYYDSSGRTYRNHKYVGVYTNKCIRGVGELKNVVRADLVGDRLNVINSEEHVTSEQRKSITEVIPHAKRYCSWDIRHGHNFFLVDEFHQTEYRKVTKGPMRSDRYFNLKEVLGLDELPDTKEIATLLREQEW